MLLFFMMKLFNIGAIQSLKEIPVDTPQIITRRIITIVREFNTGPTLAVKSLTSGWGR